MSLVSGDDLLVFAGYACCGLLFGGLVWFVCWVLLIGGFEFASVGAGVDCV